MAFRRYWWPSITEEVEKVVRECRMCAKYATSQQQAKQIDDPHPAQALMDKLALDIFQFKGSYYLFCKDIWSRYFWVHSFHICPTSQMVRDVVMMIMLQNGYAAHFPL